MQGCNQREYRANNLFIWTAMFFVSVSCESQQKTGSFSSAVSRYEEGRYAAALSESEPLMRSDDGATAAQGALIGAMSSYKLGNIDQAQRLATKASSSQDRTVSGSALVLLGDVRLLQHRPQEAGQYYSQAAAKLSGADAIHARDCAQRAQAMAATPPAPTAVVIVKERDKSDDAEVAPAPAWTLSQNFQPASKKGASSPIAPKVVAPEAVAISERVALASQVSKHSVGDRSFTIRAGSYSSQSAAEKRAKELTKDLQRTKAPMARVDTVHTVKGEDLFAVRIGTWPTRAEAEKVLNSIARHDLMVGAIDPD